jgi:hypothetical protein
MFVVFLFMGSFFGFRGTNKQFLLTVPPLFGIFLIVLKLEFLKKNALSHFWFLKSMSSLFSTGWGIHLSFVFGSLIYYGVRVTKLPKAQN